MENVKARKVGNSVTLTVPRSIKIDMGEDYTVYQGVDDVIVYAKRLENPFDTQEAIKMMDEFEDLELLDGEF